MQHNDIEQAKHWIDYLKFNIANRTRSSREDIILFIASASAAFYIYSLIYSVYKFNFWASVLPICLLIYILISSGLPLWTKKTIYIMPPRVIGWAFLVVNIIILSIWFFMLLVAFLLFKQYLILIFLLLPLFYLIRFFLFHFSWYMKNTFIIDLLNDLLKNILASKVKPPEIYEIISGIEDASLIDVFK